MDINSVYGAFGIQGVLQSNDDMKNGNINNTYKVIFCDNGVDYPYVFQKINSFVFKNPSDIMHNIDRITSHIKKRYNEEGTGDERSVLEFLPTVDGKKYYIDDEYGFWRCYHYIKDSVTYNTASDPAIIESAGKAFGTFQLMLSDFNADELFDIIPDFHNTKKRLEKFFDDVYKDEYGRASEVAAETEQIHRLSGTASILSERLREGVLPLRVTHNDTKCNNVLFDINTNEPLTVIDLDTVMPGLVAHDFGDAVRFAANTACEDERDLSQVSLDLNKYEAFTKGFIGTVGSSLTQAEIDYMALGAITITVELASRFLDDYITGDRYFKIHYPDHNLVRARCQLALAEDMERKLCTMNSIVKKYV